MELLRRVHRHRIAGRSDSPAFYARDRRRDMARCAFAFALAATLVPRPARAQESGFPWKRFAAGFVSSILAHEGGHVAASVLQGGHPWFGFNRARPTVYSGFDPAINPHKQFMFSSAGLDVQDMLDEGILDSPSRTGGAFQRGILAGGIATTAFYLTVGRTDPVSDIQFMRRTSGLTSNQIAMIYGGVALLHIVRIARDGKFADFFVRPDPRSGLGVGVDLR